MSLPAVTIVHAGSFGAFRYDDDFRDMKDVPGWYAGTKYIPLGDEGRYLSLGGDIRERFEFYSNTNIGTRPASNDSFWLQRYLLHADLHWDDARVFMQLGSHNESGREPRAKPTDVDHLDIQQAFIDYKLSAGNTSTQLRLGRQEMAYGASRLVSVRDGPNVRLAFDGARALFNGPGWRASAFAVRPVEINRGQFDDKASSKQALWGVYATKQIPGTVDAAVDLYYLVTNNEEANYESVSGNEHRSTLGGRLYGKAGGFDGDVELMLQRGDIAGQDIQAFALATDTGWTFKETVWTPRLGLRTDVISGDRRAGDGKLGTFNALYPSGSYFSEAGVLAQANLIDLSVSLAVRPQLGMSLALSLNPMWRYSNGDAVYSLPLSPLLHANASDDRYIGWQTQLLWSWQYSNMVSFRAAVVKFQAGDFVQQSGGRDLDYAQFSTSIRF